jgi:glycine dehydrogenase subunit 1
MVTVFLTVYGKGLKELGEQNLAKAHYAARVLGKSGKVLFGGAPRFNEFVLDFGIDKDAEQVNAALLKKKIIGGLPLAKWYPELGAGASLWCATELTTRKQMDAAARTLARSKA